MKTIDIIREALGEVSGLFMKQEIKGTEMVMPTNRLLDIANEANHKLTKITKPNLGCATTRELLNEITARIDVLGELDYKTVGDN